jgi:hypothetical protein
MATTTLERAAGATSFPAAAVEEKLRAALLVSVRSLSELRGTALPDDARAVYAVAVHLDSLGVVEILCEVEAILGFELKDSTVKSGGYNSIDEAIGHLMPRIEAAWYRHSDKGTKK